MAAGHKGVIAVVGAGIALGLGFVILYMTVLAPRAEKERVQGEIEDWGSRWQKARTCLVGQEPRSTDGFEAMILREAREPGPGLEAELADCVEALKDLKRESEYTSDEEDVEKSWTALAKEVSRLAKAHAWRTAREKPRPLAELQHAMADAIPGVDGAYNDLRAAADLEPSEPAGKESLPRASEGAPIVGPRGATLALRHPRLAGGVFSAWATSGDAFYFLRQKGPGEPELRPTSPHTTMSATDPSWGLWYENPAASGDATAGGKASLRAGSLDDRGNPAGESTAVLAVDGQEQDVRAIFAVGSGPLRAAVYWVSELGEATQRLYVARSSDGGATWKERIEIPAQAAVAPDFGRGRIDLHWVEGGSVLWWFHLSEETLDAPLEPQQVFGGSGSYGAHTRAPCFAPESAWWYIAGGLYYAKPGSGRAQPVPGSAEIGSRMQCDDEHLISSSVSPSEEHGQLLRITACRADRCLGATEVPLPAGAGWAATPTADRGPVAAVLTSGILTLFAGDPGSGEAFAPRTTLRAPASWEIFGLAESDGALYTVLHDGYDADKGGDKFRIAPIPAW